MTTIVDNKVFQTVMNYDGTYAEYNTERIMEDDSWIHIDGLTAIYKTWVLNQGFRLSLDITLEGCRAHIMQSDTLVYRSGKSPTEFEALQNLCLWIIENSLT